MQDETIPAGLCQCGCGQATRIAERTHSQGGQRVGQPLHFVNGHNSRARNVPACGYVIEDRGHDTPCWIWQLGRSGGYAALGGGSAHRRNYMAVYGPVPAGLELDHLCRQRDCVRPSHLEAVTHAENVRRGRRAKLTMQQANEIRAAYAEGCATQIELARRYGVNQTTVSGIVRGKAWT